MKIQSNQLWTAKDVGEYLQCAEQTVYDKVYKGIIPHIKIPSGGIRFRKEDIDRWLIERGKGNAKTPEEETK